MIAVVALVAVVRLRRVPNSIRDDRRHHGRQAQRVHSTLSKKTIVKGVTTFKVTNKGTISDDFKIAGKKTASIKVGKAATLKITLKKAGKFPYL